MAKTRERAIGKRALSNGQRRALILEALAPGANKTALCREYGIARNNLYNLIRVAIKDPKGKLRDAEEEVEFRRRVLELTR